MNSKQLIVAFSIISACGLFMTPQPTHAFTLFGIKFFENSNPSPTPTPRPSNTPTPTARPSGTPTPTPTATPSPTASASASATPTVLSQTTDKLPKTGPQENVAVIVLAITGAVIAHKFVQTSSSR